MASKPGAPETLRARKRLERIDTIEAMLLSAEPPSTTEIIDLIKKRWNIGERIAYRDLATAWHRIRDRISAERDIDAAKIRVWWERLASKAEKSGDMKAAVSGLANLTKMLGLYAPTKAQLEVTGSVKVGVQLDVRAVIGVVDADGLAALEVVMAQLERARAEGMLPEPAAAPEEPDYDEDEEPPPAGSVN